MARSEDRRGEGEEKERRRRGEGEEKERRREGEEGLVGLGAESGGARLGAWRWRSRAWSWRTRSLERGSLDVHLWARKR